MVHISQHKIRMCRRWLSEYSDPRHPMTRVRYCSRDRGFYRTDTRHPDMRVWLGSVDDVWSDILDERRGGLSTPDILDILGQ